MAQYVRWILVLGVGISELRTSRDVSLHSGSLLSRFSTYRILSG